MNKYIILLIVITLSISCTKEERGLDVAITGFVKLIDEGGVELFEKNDVKVTIQGTSGYVNTDKNGKFLFTGLNAGTPYGFDFSKDGYGTVSSGNYKFIGDQKPGLISTVTLYQMPEIELKSASLQYLNNTITIMGEISQTDFYKVRAFADDSANVSDSYYDYASYSYSASGMGFTNFQLSISLMNNNYSPGTTIYIAVYFYNYYDNGYWDSDKKLKYSSAEKVGTLEITL